MAYEEGLAELIRGDLADEPGFSEKKMFGGLCFLRYGHMVGGVVRDTGMFRVGKTNEGAALAMPGVRPMMFTGRPMSGIVEADAEAVDDDARRGELLSLALTFVRTLPPK